MFLRALFFFLTFFGFLTLAILYMAKRSMALCPLLARHPIKVWGFFLLFLLLLIGVPMLHRALNHQADLLFWPSYMLFGFISSYLLYLLVFDLGQFLLRRFAQLPQAGLWAFHLAWGGALASVILGLFMALRAPQIKEVEVPIANLHADLEGFRIVQISDLHLGPLVSKGSINRLAEQVRGQKADLIAITGDLVDGEANGIQDQAELIKALPSRHGTFFVTGNHEYYSGVQKWLGLFRQYGWRVLRNEHVVLEHGQGRLVVAGLPDPTEGRRSLHGPNVEKALAGHPQGEPVLLLYHPPKGFEAAERAGVSLQLSGHTHSGQYFPWSLIVPFFYRYPSGLNRHGNMWIYTSVGTGFWGPPNRLFVPKELTVLVLKKA